MIPQSQPKPDIGIINFPSDKNGCGYHRTYIPFNYLNSKYNYNVTNLGEFLFDLNYISKSNYIRFQRQVTEAQKKVIFEYKKILARTQSKCKLVYELDDIIHEIQPSNIVAYQFYTETKRNNLLYILKTVDTVTFSTHFLKDYYKDKYGIENSVVIPNFLPKFLYADKGLRNKYQKGKKPRILWAGSASHIGKGGDLEFLIPLIKKTKDEFEWIFLGTIPPELHGVCQLVPWSDFYSYPHALDQIDADMAISPVADNTFNYGKSDLKLLEYSAVGLPAVYSSIGSAIGPYDMIDGICAVQNREDLWYSAIKEMATDSTKWDKFMKAGRTELNKRWLEDEQNIGMYRKVFA
jgi:hypothetical protein